MTTQTILIYALSGLSVSLMAFGLIMAIDLNKVINEDIKEVTKSVKNR